MSIFAGVVAIEESAQVPAHVENILRTHLSRHPADKVAVDTGPHHVVGSVAFSEIPGDAFFRDAEGRISLLAGDPLLPGQPASLEQGEAGLNPLERLHLACWSEGGDGALPFARGEYCSAHVHPAHRRVRLCTDRLGLRPLYHAQVQGCLVFATSLRMMLMLMPALGDKPDLQARLEHATFGYALADRTPFLDIRLLKPAHLLEAEPGFRGVRAYQLWKDLIQPREDGPDQLQQLQDVFREAIRLRVAGQRSVFAQLSGGLDSRCVVAGLRDLGVEVHSINFSPPGSADLVLGRMAADMLGTHHFEATDGPASLEGRSRDAHRRLMEKLPSADIPAFARVIWSGFGGEAVLSQPEMSPALLKALEENRVDAAVTLYLDLLQTGFPARIFSSPARETLSNVLRDNLRERIKDTGTDDLVLAFNLFKVQETLRGPLRVRYEELDLNRLAYANPLCDPELVVVALSLPHRSLLRHRLYYRWLHTFKLPVSEVPWQAYPGSDPCPLPMPEGLRNQWESGWFSNKQRRRNARLELAGFGRELRSPHFPSQILNRKVLWTVYLLGLLGVHRYRYLLAASMPWIRFERMAAEAQQKKL